MRLPSFSSYRESQRSSSRWTLPTLTLTLSLVPNDRVNVRVSGVRVSGVSRVMTPCCSPDEEGVTLSLDRFDPGREQGGVRVPSLLLPGDVAVPLEFILQGDPEPSPLDLSLAFQVPRQTTTTTTTNTFNLEAPFKSPKVTLQSMIMKSQTS